MSLLTHTARFDWWTNVHCNQPAHGADFALVSLDLEIHGRRSDLSQGLYKGIKFEVSKMEMAKRIELERRGRKEDEVCVFLL